MAEPIVVEAHVGWRGELGDGTARVAAGVEGSRGPLGIGLDLGTEVGRTDYSGHLAAQEGGYTDIPVFVVRDDLYTGGLALDWRPWWQVPFGPVFGVGGELASTQETTLDYGADRRTRADPTLTAWVIPRIGVEARFGRFGGRLSLCDRMTSLNRPDPYTPAEHGDPAFVQVWRLDADLLVRL